MNKKLLLAAGSLLVAGCQVPTSSKPDLGSPAAGLDTGIVSKTSLGCQSLAARLLEGEPFSGKIRVQFDVTRATTSGEAHLAVFLAGAPVGQQELVISEGRFYVPADKSFTIELAAPAVCGRHYQVDAGCGLVPPPGASYEGASDFVMSWELGVRFAGSTPSPRTTPSPSPTSTPSATPTPGPRSTPSPSPTPTPTPSPTPRCSQANPPLHMLGSLLPLNPVMLGDWLVQNDGEWQLRLLAASSVSEYTADNPDFVKDVKTKHLICGNSFVLNVSYAWAGHGSEVWWMELRRNGAFMGKSPYVLNPYN